MGSNPTGSALALQVVDLGGFSYSMGHQDRQCAARDTEMPERAKVWVRAERSELIFAKAGSLTSASRPRIAAGDRRSIPPAPLYGIKLTVPSLLAAVWFALLTQRDRQVGDRIRVIGVETQYLPVFPDGAVSVAFCVQGGSQAEARVQVTGV